MNRRVVQICCSRSGDVDVLYALMSDGSLWQLFDAPDIATYQWKRLPSPPQNDDEEPKG